MVETIKVMKIRKITLLNNFSQPHLVRLAQLMAEVDEVEYAVYFSQHYTLQLNGGVLFVAEIKGIPVGYLFFAKCRYDSHVLKISYFAIEPSERYKGLGAKLLKKGLSLTKKKHYILNCQPTLRNFYEQLGFVYVRDSINDNTICMVLKNDDMAKAHTLPDQEYYQPCVDKSYKLAYQKMFTIQP
ncbi:MAG: putative GNAT family N-acyltransferase [Colwellia sp.]|jgi:predicted GNAT family N-acyltransferase